MSAPVLAAGALCWRIINDKIVILVVHRTKYGDVSLPKGKVDPGESLPQTAIREIAEETGYAISLGPKLGVSEYAIGSGKQKSSHFWAAEVTDRALARSTFVPNREIAAIEWVSPKKAHKYLTYDRDVQILESFERLVDRGITSTFALLILRHGKATARSEWTGADAQRPLTDRGVKQVAANVPTLLAWGPRRLMTSDAARCVATVAPLAAATGLVPRVLPGLSQDAFEEGTGEVRAIIGKRIRSGKNAVLCSHGPVLPDILREISLATGSIPTDEIRQGARLEPGGFTIVQLSATNPTSGIISVETYPPFLG